MTDKPAKSEIEILRNELKEARETIGAIRRGEIDALVIKGKHGHEVYTLESADHAYRVFLEKMTEGAVTLDEYGAIQYSNSSFASMIRLTPALIVAELFQDYVVEEDRGIFSDLLKQGWTADVKGEIHLLGHDHHIPVQLSMAALKIGKNIALSILITNLTTQKEAQSLLEVKNDQLAVINMALGLSNQDLQQFASVASHDLQEPLRKIMLFASKLKDDHHHELSSAGTIFVEKIAASAARMKALIIDILNYSSLSSENNNKFELTDIKAMIHELLEDFEITIQEKNATICVDELPDIPVIRGQIRQVFQNLISNALKFIPKGERPRIDIHGTPELEGFCDMTGYNGKFCHIHVRDNGIGFDDMHSKTIFNLFEKLNSRAEYEGTGIGLAICKKVVERHFGQIKVHSKPGTGSEFIISLPCEHQ